MPARKNPASLHSRKAGSCIALLRGINVGGRNKLPMAELMELFVHAGCTDVRTYIQSGNVIFAASRRTISGIARVTADGIERRFGFRSPVVIRTADEFAAAVAGNPFAKPKSSVAADSLHVAFLAAAPDPRRVAALDPNRSPGDSFVVRGREIYLHLPNGAGRTKLTNAYLDSTLGTISTLRNWRTVLKLLEMTSRSP